MTIEGPNAVTEDPNPIDTAEPDEAEAVAADDAAAPEADPDLTPSDAEYLQMGQHVPVNLPSFKILTEHEVTYANTYTDFKGESRIWGKAKKFYEWMVQLNYEVEVCRSFDRVGRGR